MSYRSCLVLVLLATAPLEKAKGGIPGIADRLLNSLWTERIGGALRDLAAHNLSWLLLERRHSRGQQRYHPRTWVVFDLLSFRACDFVFGFVGCFF